MEEGNRGKLTEDFRGRKEEDVTYNHWTKKQNNLEVIEDTIISSGTSREAEGEPEPLPLSDGRHFTR